MGICAPSDVPELPERLKAFVDAGYHGQMTWMEERMNWRSDPQALWGEAKSIIMFAEPYTPEHDPLESLNHPEKAAISVYAQNRDYHDLVKKRLKHVGRWLIETCKKGGYRDENGKLKRIDLPEDVEIKVFVDTAPVMEKPLAAAAGLGWQGKHTNLLSRDLGNWFFLGAIFTTLDLHKDGPVKANCGNCTACLDACPTQAFPAPYQLDARRCISYLTIEHKGPVPLELREKMGNRIYGCDDCLGVCPWNKFAAEAREMKYQARPDLLAPDLEMLAKLDDTAFRAMFSGTPIKRIGRDRFVRNVLYAIGNSGKKELSLVAQSLCEDPDDTVAEAAKWAVERLS